jgi:HEAT repeat protein
MMATNPAFIEKWVRYLNEADREMCQIAAAKLGSTGDPEVIPELIKSLNNRPDEVRIAVIHALGQIGDSSAVRPLSRVLRDGNPLVAATAATALGQIGDATAVPYLVRTLNDHKNKADRHGQLHGSSRGLYLAAVHALEKIGTRDAKQAVKQYHR